LSWFVLVFRHRGRDRLIRRIWPGAKRAKHARGFAGRSGFPAVVIPSMDLIGRGPAGFLFVVRAGARSPDRPDRVILGGVLCPCHAEPSQLQQQYVFRGQGMRGQRPLRVWQGHRGRRSRMRRVARTTRPKLVLGGCPPGRKAMCKRRVLGVKSTSLSKICLQNHVKCWAHGAGRKIAGVSVLLPE
jgi:hypothetical protein